MNIQRLHSLGGWLSLLAIVEQLLVPVSHLAMIRSSASSELSAAFCQERASAALQDLARGLPAELRETLTRTQHRALPACGSCLSPGPCALPLPEPPRIPGFSHERLQTALVVIATDGLRASWSTPPSTGPPVRT